MARFVYSSLEPLEARIAPAALVGASVLPDIIAGVGKTGATVDLGNMFAESGYRTEVEFTTNFDTDPNTAGLQAGKFVIELFDDKAPITVENFLKYVNNQNASGDYDGTFFHRLALTETGAPFVLQGGAFESTDLQTHIPTGREIHNEFNPTDAERSNVRGTIAMAKTALGPNTASSEFFFNLGDNSANLDEQNGGFTVFGRVKQGMDVIDKIAALTRYDLSTNFNNSALGEVPIQKVGTPAQDQLVAIVDAKVLSPADVSPSGVTYSVNITDLNGQPTNLVSGKLTGDTLQLAYKPGATGQVKVSVTATNGESSHTDDFTVTVRPNLVADMQGDNLPELLVAGNSGKAKVTLSNVSGGAAEGKVDVKFFLSRIDEVSDPFGVNLDASDVQVGAVLGKNVSIGSGKSLSLTSKLTIPQSLALADADSYRLIAQVTTSEGSSITELFTDDNTTLQGRLHGYFNSTSANLLAVGADDSIPSVTVPGEQGIGKVLVVNNSGQIAKGKVDVRFFLSHVDNHTTQTLNTGDDPYGITLQETDVEIGSVLGKNVTIPAGKSLILSGAIQIPPELMQLQGDVYRVIAKVTPSAGSTLTELVAQDNVAYDNSVHGIVNAFGTFGLSDPNGSGETIVRKNVTLNYVDGWNNTVKMSLTGQGVGFLSLDSEGNVDLATEDTGLKSVLTARTAPGGTILRNIVTVDNQPLATVSMGTVQVQGDIYFNGGVKNLTLGFLEAPDAATHQFYIGALTGSSAKANIQLGSVMDYKLYSEMPINKLAVVRWVGQNADQEGILAPAITTFVSQGDVMVNMLIQGASKMESFTVNGALTGSRIDILGDVGTVKLGGMYNSAIYVGSNGQGQFRDDGSVGKFTIQGASGFHNWMINSELRVGRIGTVDVDEISTEDPRPYGIVTHAIKSYNRGTVHLSNLVGPSAPVDQQGAYSVQLV